ncbi:MAG: GH92 family glycosyl hydrolase, partial [Acidobacteriaceae bacterium]
MVESERNLIPVRIVMRAILLLVILSLTTGAFAREGASPTSSVNAMIGTGQGPGGSQNLFPGATLPFGMVQLSPDTEDHGFGYHYYQNQIQGFSMTHMSGVGCANEGDVFFTATTGPVGTQVADFESPYSHSQESATPGYYQVRLSRWDVNAELTATDRTGLARFTFPAGKPANILVPISHTLNQTMGAHVRVVGNNRIEGYVEDQAFCGVKPTYKVYFVMTFSRPFATFGTWTGQKENGKKGEGQKGAAETVNAPAVKAGSRAEMQTRDSQWIGAYASWPTASEAQTITAKIGISYVDLAGAENNLKKEASGKDFSEVRREAAAAWNKALSAIDISGGTPTERTVFYTGLYHSLMMPSIFSDADGRYLGFDQKIHTVAAGHLVYGNYSGWDIYRSQMPLLALIEPRRAEDMAESIVLMYKQGGWIGRWPQINQYTNVMAGSPLTTVVATTWLDGLHGFDMDTAWQGMWKDATEAPPAGMPYQGQEGIDWINRIHYVPNDKVKYGSVSQLQEDGAAYASLYYLAKNLGKTDAAKTLYERALYYRNVFNPQDRFFRPRNADGQWVEPFDPSQDEHGFIEGSGWHYQWFAPWDMAWLIHAM